MIDRNDEYDAALARLYKATIAAKGRSPGVKDGVRRERKAMTSCRRTRPAS